MSGTQSYQLSDYLEKLPATSFRKLYQQPSTAFAIFRRMLPMLAKVFVQALLYMPGPLPLSQLDDIWVKPEGRMQRDRALAALRSLHVAQITPPGKDKPQEIQLTTNFKNSMRLALEGGGDHKSFGVPSTLPIDPTVNIDFLDRYSRKKWEDILHYVVNSVGVSSDMGGGGGGGGGGSMSGSSPKTSVKDLLLAGHLVDRRPDSKTGIVITKTGFTFLLESANAQVWTLLLLWLEASEQRSGSRMDSIDQLSFLFMLATLELGRAYDTQALTATRQNMLPDLVDFGLIYTPRDTRQYFPTRLATTLTSSTSPLRSVSEGFAAATANASGDAASLGAPASVVAEAKGTIIVETNYRIYAYTSSPLQIAVLALFTQLNMRFAGMVTGRLTRDSIRRAITYGITADQIISYLASHAHEQMTRVAASTGRSVLPPTVVDQIRLWQLESERMRTNAGFLFRDFDTPDEYAALSVYAEEIGVLVWKSNKKQMFFVSKYEPLRDWLKSRKK
ncbi:transcription factor TFIIH subunit p52/Tfb2 [Lasiosphaeria miniovina]|uniref:RNA polymerase II transcription factor B subunit 2 n=1 Tax=Lasiosphaeria miniovina TaxID=1954250 RepID=A0AA40A672_9PEZI|nr:transcription factor TFIIH subunit p52/Tfb2 [Lasiosphaeria miniovina]KAK0709906.1 transcription factor TFIIH subunit p52/Tfb2 [Lasiosphaeria miniovina]